MSVLCGLIGKDLVWLLQHDLTSDSFNLSRCLHPMERCALQGFQAEQLAGMSKAGVLRATGNAMSTPVVAAVLKRCMVSQLHSPNCVPAHGLQTSVCLEDLASWAFLRSPCCS